MFDSVVFAHFPRGLYLAKKLSEEGKKTAYIELLPKLKNPFGLFLDEHSQSEKALLDSLGFLFQQKGGFCLLSPQGVWSLQDMKPMQDRLSLLKNKIKKAPMMDFENHWLSYLAYNTAGKIFKYNNSEFSDESLNLFSDYFLFEPSLKKIKQFQESHSNISFYQTSFDSIQFEKQKSHFIVQEKPLPSKEYFFLGYPHLSIVSDKKTIPPDWQWEACFFKSDFGDYENIIPSHFVSLKNPLLPWSHENLISVFHKEGWLEAWLRVPYRSKETFTEGVKEHLELFFPGCVFSPVEKKSPPSLKVYGNESLLYKKSNFKNGLYVEDLNYFFQGDLISEIRGEQKLFDSFKKKNKEI